MLVDAFTKIANQYEGTNPLYLRVLLKEYIQNYILNFIYNSKEYNKLIFTGGTCLRKIYGLNRLSEDLDFDFEWDFILEEFSANLRKYLVSSLDFNGVNTKLSSNRQSVVVKFDILDKVGLAKTPADTKSLFVRCDFVREDTGIYGDAIRTVSTPQFTFFARCYDLETLYANKIIAFLERSFFKGSTQKISFKGRDVYDLVWFKERSLREGLSPNNDRLKAKLNLGEKQAWEKVKEKVKFIDEEAVYKDIAPFLPSDSVAREYSLNFKKILLK